MDGSIVKVSCLDAATKKAIVAASRSKTLRDIGGDGGAATTTPAILVGVTPVAATSVVGGTVGGISVGAKRSLEVSTTGVVPSTGIVPLILNPQPVSIPTLPASALLLHSNPPEAQPAAALPAPLSVVILDPAAVAASTVAAGGSSLILGGAAAAMGASSSSSSSSAVHIGIAPETLRLAADLSQGIAHKRIKTE